MAESWKLQPEQVIGLINTARERQHGLTHVARPQHGVDLLEGIRWDGYAGAVVAPLTQAIFDLLEVQSRHLSGIYTLAETCLSSLSNTTLAYQSGMQDMAREHERALLSHAEAFDQPPVVRPLPEGP